MPNEQKKGPSLVIGASFMMRIHEGIVRRWRKVAERVATATGQYERWRQVEWARVQRLVFVCSGNICRSPFAEQLSRDRGFSTVSCGITALKGAPADSMAIQVAERFGVDLRTHRSLALEDIAFTPKDLLLVMDSRHVPAARTIAQEHGCQLTLLGLWGSHHQVAIEDPFGGEEAEFEACFGRIVASLNDVLEKTKN